MTSVGAHAAAEEAPSDAELDAAPSAPAAAAKPAAQPGPTSADRTVQVEPINLIESAGPAIAKRLIPVAIGAVLLFLILRRRAKG